MSPTYSRIFCINYGLSNNIVATRNMIMGMEILESEFCDIESSMKQQTRATGSLCWVDLVRLAQAICCLLYSVYPKPCSLLTDRYRSCISSHFPSRKQICFCVLAVQRDRCVNVNQDCQDWAFIACRSHVGFVCAFNSPFSDRLPRGWSIKLQVR